MRVALFVPCYVDQLWPEVGIASADLLERLGVEVDFPEAQTCCGQPFVNAGFPGEARALAQRFLRVFEGAERIVCPSGSCVAMVRHQYARLLGGPPPGAERVHELCEFVVDVLGVRSLAGRFPHRVGLHPSCHGLRELRLGPASERVGAPAEDKAALLLAGLAGLELVAPARRDECCGFGGSFSVDEPDVSCRMGLDRLAAHEAAGAEVVTSVDASCLFHLRGLAERRGSQLRILHVAEILAGAHPEAGPR